MRILFFHQLSTTLRCFCDDLFLGRGFSAAGSRWFSDQPRCLNSGSDKRVTSSEETSVCLSPNDDDQNPSPFYGDVDLKLPHYYPGFEHTTVTDSTPSWQSHCSAQYLIFLQFLFLKNINKLPTKLISADGFSVCFGRGFISAARLNYGSADWEEKMKPGKTVLTHSEETNNSCKCCNQQFICSAHTAAPPSAEPRRRGGI